MERVCIKHGVYSGLQGDAVYLPNTREFSVSIPSINNPQIKEFFDPKSLSFLVGQRPAPILEKKEFITLQKQTQDVQIIGCKASCSSVWCKDCFIRKGASKRYASRLSRLDPEATRQVVLTVDPKKFEFNGQLAFETLKEKEAISQFIHNLERTSKIKIVDWVWILEWHITGFPHWHVFIQTQKGKSGQIGNEILRKHWKYGLIYESYIKSELHWKKFTDYFGSNGYFNPTSKYGKDKSHQLTLPDWAMSVKYSIRKMGSKIKPSSEKEITQKENYIEEKPESKLSELKTNELKEKQKLKKKATYKEILDSCGQATNCLIRRGDSLQIWKKYNIPYRLFSNQYSGEYIQGTGYIIQMNSDEFFLFDALYNQDDAPKYLN